jgi:hypothetical protein
LIRLKHPQSTDKDHPFSKYRAWQPSESATAPVRAMPGAT